MAEEEGKKEDFKFNRLDIPTEAFCEVEIKGTRRSNNSYSQRCYFAQPTPNQPHARLTPGVLRDLSLGGNVKEVVYYLL